MVEGKEFRRRVRPTPAPHAEQRLVGPGARHGGRPRREPPRAVVERGPDRPGMGQTPWTKNPFARAAASRSAFSGRYSSESYQRLAASRLGNSRITGNVGFAPSTTSNFPPATRTRPLYF